MFGAEAEVSLLLNFRSQQILLYGKREKKSTVNQLKNFNFQESFGFSSAFALEFRLKFLGKFLEKILYYFDLIVCKFYKKTKKKYFKSIYK